MQGKLAASAFSLFSERGIDRVTMAEIAARAGVTKGSLYWHYQSKGEVIRAACRHYYQSWHARMRRELEGLAKPVERMATAIGSSVRTCLIDESNRTFTLEWFRLSIHDREVRKGWRAFSDDVKAFYVALLTEIVRAGDRVADDPEAAVDLMLAAMEGYKLRALFEPRLRAPAAGRRIARDLLAILGIMPRPSPPRSNAFPGRKRNAPDLP